ncbi:family 16 glycoside hydrolase [Hirschia litorea]|uniref:Family 16 glycoside hydrolase n=1 Tax=Hirschia litorea TaxID=1199156 RepID=A0ABW2IPN2_9PROT
MRIVSGTSIVALVAALGACSTSMHPLEKAEWKSLFDGKSLDGWTVVNGDDPFEVVDGAIVGKTVSGVPTRYLTSEKTYGDFIFEAEMNNAEGANSGIQFRSQIGTWFYSGLNGYQLEVDHSDRLWTGGIYTEGLAVWKYPVIENDACRAAWNNAQWNKLRIEAKGTQLRTFVNDTPCAYVYDETLLEGYLGLQVHSIGTNPERAGKPTLWRNVRIQDAPKRKAYTPDDLTVASESYLWSELSPSEKAQGWMLINNSQTTGAKWTAKNRKNQITGEVRSIPMLSLSRSGDAIASVAIGSASYHVIMDFQLTEGSAGEVLYPITYKNEIGKSVSCVASYRIFDDKSPENEGVEDTQKMGALRGSIAAKNLNETVIGKRVFSKGAWQRLEIKVEGGEVEHWLNSVKVVEYQGCEGVNSNVLSDEKLELNLLMEQGDMRINMVKYRSSKMQS